MLVWNAWHPYNAVHGVRLAGAPDLERLRSVIRATLGRWGLCGLDLDASSGTFSFRGGPPECELRPIAGEGDSEIWLSAEVERQLNTPFPATGRINPFRFLVAGQPQSFWLVLAYFHAVADAQCIVFFMRDVARAYAGTSAPASLDEVDLYPSCAQRLLLRRPAVLARTLADLPARIRNMRRSSRPPYLDPSDFNNGFTMFSIAAPALRSLLSAGKEWEVSFNDVLLALLLKALSGLEPVRRRAGRRDRISVGTIVNVRREAGLEGRRALGVVLGSFVLTHAVPLAISLKALAREIRERTRRVKQRKLYLGLSVEMAVARLALGFFSTGRRRTFYQKFFPLWGGVTNMNLNALWAPEAGERTPDYFRAVSTGPVTPLVLSLTTAGETATIGLSFRTTVYTKADIGLFQQTFLDLSAGEGAGWA
jgi:hypothetical protein